MLVTPVSYNTVMMKSNRLQCPLPASEVRFAAQLTPQQKLAGKIDYTKLSFEPDEKNFTDAIYSFVEGAARYYKAGYKFASICIRPEWVSRAMEVLKESNLENKLKLRKKLVKLNPRMDLRAF